MPRAYNGMEADPDPRRIGVVPFVVAGVGFPGGVKQGAPYVVMGWLAQAFHDTVEPLREGWCWGYAYRENRNAANLSVHAAGGAIDCNAPRHPNGARGTFTSKQVRAIRALLEWLEGAVTWGGDFTGTVDEMHFELCDNPALVARIARKINEEDGMALSDDDIKKVAAAVYKLVHKDAVAILRGVDQPAALDKVKADTEAIRKKLGA